MEEGLTEEMKVRDEEPNPKRQHVLGTLDLTEEIWAPPDWEILPYHLIVQVYRYLKDSDRLAMAQVCQAWYAGFKNPSLWKKREFFLGGPNGELTCKNAIGFASLFGSCLQDVVIRFDNTTPVTCTNIAETMEQLMVKLESARLHRLHLLELQLNKFDKFPELNSNFGCCLAKMLKSQTALKNVVLHNCNFYHEPGTDVLKTLQESSGQTLQFLHLIDPYLAFDPALDKHFLKFELDYTDFQKFQNLRELSLHYNSLPEEMLQKLMFNLKDKLQVLALFIMDYEMPYNVITSRTWKHITEACPQLKVFLLVFHFFPEKDIIDLLVPGIPLIGFLLRSDVKSEHDIKLASTLTHLADNFNKDLFYFKLLLPYLQDSVDNEITRIVEKCRYMAEMSVPTSAANGVAEVLRHEYRERLVRKVRFEKRRHENLENSEPYQDIVITFHETLDNSPSLTVEWVDEE